MGGLGGYIPTCIPPAADIARVPLLPGPSSNVPNASEDAKLMLQVLYALFGVLLATHFALNSSFTARKRGGLSRLTAQSRPLLADTIASLLQRCGLGRKRLLLIPLHNGSSIAPVIATDICLNNSFALSLDGSTWNALTRLLDPIFQPFHSL